jgi:hypothetical protein
MKDLSPPRNPATSQHKMQRTAPHPCVLSQKDRKMEVPLRPLSSTYVIFHSLGTAIEGFKSFELTCEQWDGDGTTILIQSLLPGQRLSRFVRAARYNIMCPVNWLFVSVKNASRIRLARDDGMTGWIRSIYWQPWFSQLIAVVPWKICQLQLEARQEPWDGCKLIDW